MHEDPLTARWHVQYSACLCTPIHKAATPSTPYAAYPVCTFGVSTCTVSHSVRKSTDTVTQNMLTWARCLITQAVSHSFDSLAHHWLPYCCGLSRPRHLSGKIIRQKRRQITKRRIQLTYSYRAKLQFCYFANGWKPNTPLVGDSVRCRYQACPTRTGRGGSLIDYRVGSMPLLQEISKVNPGMYHEENHTTKPSERVYPILSS